MAEPLRIGIIGAGNAGRAHAAAFARLPGVAVAAVWSRTRSRAEALVAGLGGPEPPAVRVCDAWEDVIDAEVDVVSVATPPMLRRAPVAAAFERGRHVLVEKEFTLDLADARTLAALATRAGVVSAVSLNWRYAPGNQVARRAVETGQIGQLTDIRMELRYRITRPMEVAAAAKPWVQQRAQGGGGLRSGGSHEFDRARFLTGWDFTRVVGRLAPYLARDGSMAIPDGHYLVLADMATGAQGGLGMFRTIFTRGQAEWQTALGGADGTLVVANTEVSLQRGEDDAPSMLPILAPDEVSPGVRPVQHTWNRLIADFVTAIRAGDVAHTLVPHLPSFADGLRLHEVFAAVERADAESRWVALAEVRE